MSAIYEVSVEGVHNLMMELDAMRRRAEASEANLAKTKLALDAEKALADRFRAHQAIGDRLAEQQSVRENLRDRNRQLEQELAEIRATIADCPLLYTTTCNVAERNWIARAKQHLAK